MQNSRNAREAELPAELPQVPLMLPNRRHGHQSSPSCLQKSTEPPQSSPDMQPMAEWQQPPPPSPGDWRGMRIIVVQLTWASARRNRRAAGRATPVTQYAARFACAATTNPHSACKFARAAQSSPDMPPNGRTAAAAAPGPGDSGGMHVIMVQLLWHAPRPWRTESATICTPAFQRYGPGRGTHPAILPLPQVPTPKLTQSPSSHNTASWPLRRPACDCTPPDVELSLRSIPAKTAHAST